jgi:hypothetical protein
VNGMVADLNRQISALAIRLSDIVGNAERIAQGSDDGAPPPRN